MLVVDVILQIGLDAVVRRKQTLQFLLSLVEQCHGKNNCSLPFPKNRQIIPFPLPSSPFVVADSSDEVDIGVERDKEMSGGTPVASGSMRQRHSQGYASDNEDLKDDDCSRLQPFLLATPRARTWTEILKNVLWVASALFIIYFGDRHSNYIYIYIYCCMMDESEGK
ncbi:hypothetical protein GQ457_03G003620 [Hibiscus cannabinus]